MREPRWVPRLVLEALHFDQLREHGGMPGLRDENGFEAALARPKQKWAYEKEVDLALLAAAYGFGLASNHPFNDGNKRIAFVAMSVFLGLNDYAIEAPELEAVSVMLALAEGRLTETELAGWIRGYLVPTS